MQPAVSQSRPATFKRGRGREERDDGDIGEEERKETILFIYLREK